MKRYIFSFIFLISGCEIPHTNLKGEYAICNIYDEVANELILCPEVSGVNVNVGTIPVNLPFLIRFLNSEQHFASEVGNSILTIYEQSFLDNNMSFIKVVPNITGTTIVAVDDLNLTFSVK